MSTNSMPAAFIGHGAPTVALDPDKGAELATWGDALGKPSAVLVVSAHWTPAALALGTVERRELVYDFYGFPKPLYEVRYPAPGAPALADRVEVLLKGAFPVAREPERGLDHGVWTPLVHLYPSADVPVLQLSLPLSFGAAKLLELGRALAPLRSERVLIVGSGNATHNLRRASLGNEGAPALPEASEFDLWLTDALDRWDVDALLDAPSKAPAFRLNHPTVEHWVPIYVAMGAIGDRRPTVTYPITGFEYAALSRRSVQLA